MGRLQHTFLALTGAQEVLIWDLSVNVCPSVCVLYALEHSEWL